MTLEQRKAKLAAFVKAREKEPDPGEFSIGQMNMPDQSAEIARQLLRAIEVIEQFCEFYFEPKDKGDCPTCSYDGYIYFEHEEGCRTKEAWCFLNSLEAPKGAV